jgi:adenine-specific DNA-methyltransferase
MSYSKRVSSSDIFDNLLINGDNLLALKALEAEFAGKVKCVYIDPPYNTGYAFPHYDDGIEHSLWLSLMRDRLECLRTLLMDSGVIVVQIGFDEMAYCKVLMDDVFGRNNCIGQVAVRMSHSAGMKRQAKDRRLIKNTEYLLVYFKAEQPTLYPLYEKVTEYPVNYYQWIESFPDGVRPGRFVPLTEVVAREFQHLLNKHGLKATNKAIALLFEEEDEFSRFVIENRTRIGRKDSNAPAGIVPPPSLAQDEFIQIDSDSRTYFIGRSGESTWQIYTIADKVRSITYADEEGQVHQEYAIANLVGDWWDGFWRDMSRVDVEGGVKMKESKKPERLIQWVIELTTQPGDLVLDSFLGSGTTAAVAHKLGRRWIGIELGEHCRNLAAVRLRKVIDGTDNNGITRSSGWRGGGGFRFHTLAPSLLEKDRWGNWIVSREYNSAMLAEAMCKLEGFRYAPDREVFWKHGHSTERDLIYVTTQNLSREQLEFISDQVGKERTLLICCAAFRSKNDFSNLTVKKIPQTVLFRCEWGRDDYSLNINEQPAVVAVEEANSGRVASEGSIAGSNTTKSSSRRGRKDTMQDLRLIAEIENGGKRS